MVVVFILPCCKSLFVSFSCCSFTGRRREREKKENMKEVGLTRTLVALEVVIVLASVLYRLSIGLHPYSGKLKDAQLIDHIEIWTFHRILLKLIDLIETCRRPRNTDHKHSYESR